MASNAAVGRAVERGTSSSGGSSSSTASHGTTSSKNPLSNIALSTKKKANSGAIAGAVLGALVVLAAVLALVLLLLWRKKRAEESNGGGERMSHSDDGTIREVVREVEGVRVHQKDGETAHVEVNVASSTAKLISYGREDVQELGAEHVSELPADS